MVCNISVVGTFASLHGQHQYNCCYGYDYDKDSLEESMCWKESTIHLKECRRHAIGEINTATNTNDYYKSNVTVCSHRLNGKLQFEKTRSGSIGSDSKHFGYWYYPF